MRERAALSCVSAPQLSTTGCTLDGGGKRYFIKRSHLSTNDAYFLSAGSCFEGSKSRYFRDGTGLTSSTAFIDFFFPLVT